MMIFLGPLIPAGLFWYGWSAQAHTHWIVPIIGTSFVGFGILGIFVCVCRFSLSSLSLISVLLFAFQWANPNKLPAQTYLVDAYTRYAASAIAANTLLRSILGSMVPLFGYKMYESLGLGWGNSLLGFIAIAFLPLPVLFYKFGERIRMRTTVKLWLSQGCWVDYQWFI